MDMSLIPHLRDCDSRWISKKEKPGAFRSICAQMKFSVKSFVGQFVIINQKGKRAGQWAGQRLVKVGR